LNGRIITLNDVIFPSSFHAIMSVPPNNFAAAVRYIAVLARPFWGVRPQANERRRHRRAARRVGPRRGRSREIRASAGSRGGVMTAESTSAPEQIGFRAEHDRNVDRSAFLSPRRSHRHGRVLPGSTRDECGPRSTDLRRVLRRGPELRPGAAGPGRGRTTLRSDSYVVEASGSDPPPATTIRPGSPIALPKKVA
jgi:hypothetical protein